MSTTVTLKAEKREGTGKGVARQLRLNGRIPAVVYGREMDAIHISLNTREAEYLFHSISVDNTIVELAVEGTKESFQTLVREIQTHPAKASLLHVDFIRIQKGVAVEMDVPVHLVGTPIGVRIGGGIIEQVIHDLPIRCIPSMIPDSIEVDVTGLDLNDVIHVADIVFSEGVEVMVPQDTTICSVSLPRAEVAAGAEDHEAKDPELVGKDTDGDGED
ncbi:MAG: 50S ribosomal protein L25 [Gemmatimonadetes bacterium]|nr:50S ribosomal protein L25 [Gemmatimonadota bacterium]MDA1104105.1 50S ribosomal protein L25 [Gemmatimonadota bacterium]